ncbi:hypothetical protein TNCV_1663491 [Trichonephila clavipes]|nr:hypothetical protein TNCV_1663491 [Trichonephila clavipes]
MFPTDKKKINNEISIVPTTILRDPGLFSRPWCALEAVTCVGQLLENQDLVCDILMRKGQMDLVMALLLKGHLKQQQQ